MIGNKWDKTIVTDITMYYSCTVGGGRLATFVKYWSFENCDICEFCANVQSNLNLGVSLRTESHLRLRGWNSLRSQTLLIFKATPENYKSIYFSTSWDNLVVKRQYRHSKMRKYSSKPSSDPFLSAPGISHEH